MATLSNLIRVRDGQVVPPSGSPWQIAAAQRPAQPTGQPGMGSALGGGMTGQLGAAAQYGPGMGGLSGSPAPGPGGWATIAAQRPATPSGQPGMGTPPAGGDPGPGMSPTGRAGLGTPSAGMGMGPGMGRLSDGGMAGRPALSRQEAIDAYMAWDPFAQGSGMRGAPGVGHLQGTLQGMAAAGSAAAQYQPGGLGMAGAGLGPGVGHLSDGGMANQFSATPHYGPTNGPAPHPAQYGGMAGSDISNQIAWGPQSPGGMANQSGAAAQYQPGGMAQYGGGQPGAFPWLPQPAAGGGSPYQLPRSAVGGDGLAGLMARYSPFGPIPGWR
jgi:hypothetical protein